ncbi:DUF4034 domain-containing protein [Streptomyces orinoci]|uniref:DUF4034 domain-containing protein n=1 Tax=Streptomyces orinoci TaxID=67339 RepID=A0ABV3JYW0_STRON|nr:DUF4034 domain-containing protein [Streptomyces orinoci]
MTAVIPFTILVLMLIFWLRNKRRAARAATLAVRAGADLLPPERQRTDRAFADPSTEAVLTAAAQGDWQPAARALAMAGTDWERRSHLVDALAGQAAKEDSWLRAWQAACPEDPAAAVVHAAAKVSLAWEIRGSARAAGTTREQFAGFHRLLGEARQDFARAQALAPPDDPTPYIAQIPLHKGLGAPHEAMRQLWAEVTARAPYHYAAHRSALQYWCAKWRGSAELAQDFAARAAAVAPPGSLLTMLPIISWFEHNSDAPDKAYGWPEMRTLTETALRDLAAADPGHPGLAEARHLLAYCLTRQGSHAAALEQFRQVDGFVGALPWHYYTDPAKVFCAYRERALRGALIAQHAN